MKLYLSLEQMKLVQAGLYDRKNAYEAMLKKGVEHQLKDTAEDSLQQLGMLIALLNENIQKETT